MSVSVKKVFDRTPNKKLEQFSESFALHAQIPEKSFIIDYYGQQGSVYAISYWSQDPNRFCVSFSLPDVALGIEVQPDHLLFNA